MLIALGLLGGSILAAPLVYFGVEQKLAGLTSAPLNLAGPTLVVLAAGYLNGVLGFRVNQARITYNVPWPTLYASGDSNEAHLYNCVQRAHQSYLEGLPAFFSYLYVASTSFPILSTLGGLLFLSGKVVGSNGYSSGDVAKKNAGAFGYFGFFLLGGLSTISFVRLFLH